MGPRPFPTLLVALLCGTLWMATALRSRATTGEPQAPAQGAPVSQAAPGPSANGAGIPAEADPINLSHAQYHGTRDVTTNEDGFRDAAQPAPRAPGEIRVLCIGDSQTFGAGLEPDQAWPRRLQAMLGAHVTVINAGLPGYDARRGAELLARVAERYDPQIVVADFGYNDVHVPAPNGQWHTESAAHMTRMDALMRARGGHLVFVAEAIRESSPQVSAQQRAQLADAYRTAAAAAREPFVLGQAAVGKVPEASRYNDNLDVHLSGPGSDALAQAVAAAIRTAGWLP